MAGKVYLVGAGPGDPELLTIKAVRVLRSADVVLHDELVSPEVLEFASPAANVINVGKRCGRKGISQEEIHWLMIAYAGEGLTVVRLKGGDPLIFGRAGEEIEALREAQIDFEIVPGVTAALAAAAAAGISLTDRRAASALILATGHPAARKPDAPRAVIPPGVPADLAYSTLAVYMPGSDYARLRSDLLAAGLPAQTPCLLVSGASSRSEEVWSTTVDELPSVPRLPSPSILIVGRVAAKPAETAKRQASVLAAR